MIDNLIYFLLKLSTTVSNTHYNVKNKEASTEDLKGLLTLSDIDYGYENDFGNYQFFNAYRMFYNLK